MKKIGNKGWREIVSACLRLCVYTNTQRGGGENEIERKCEQSQLFTNCIVQISINLELYLFQNMVCYDCDSDCYLNVQGVIGTTNSYKIYSTDLIVNSDVHSWWLIAYGYVQHENKILWTVRININSKSPFLIFISPTIFDCTKLLNISTCHWCINIKKFTWSSIMISYGYNLNGVHKFILLWYTLYLVHNRNAHTHTHTNSIWTLLFPL